MDDGEGGDGGVVDVYIAAAGRSSVPYDFSAIDARATELLIETTNKTNKQQHEQTGA